MKLPFRIGLAHLLACVLCLLVLLLVAIVFWPQSQVSGLTIAFVGFTNAPGQPRFAVFGVTNVSRRAISFLVVPEPQIRIDGAWSEVVIVGGRPMNDLGRGQGTNFSMAVPTRGEAWRIPIIWGYNPSTAEWYLYRVRGLLRTGKHGSLSGWKSGINLPSYTNISAEMELPKAEPDGPATRSQPVRPETNQSSAAAGSGR